MIINPTVGSQGGVTIEQVRGEVQAAVPKKTSELENDSGFLTQHQDISGKLDKTATAAAATKLATSRTIRANLASTTAASFNGTANVTPGVTGVLPVANGGTGSDTEKYLPLAGGTLTGNLTLKGSGNYGTRINLGDGDYVHISEPEDDCLEIKAKKINFVVSDTTSSRITVNGSPLGGGGLEQVKSFSLNVNSSYRISNLDANGFYLIAYFINSDEIWGTAILPMAVMNTNSISQVYVDYELSTSGGRLITKGVWAQKTSETAIDIYTTNISSGVSCVVYKLG